MKSVPACIKKNFMILILLVFAVLLLTIITYAYEHKIIFIEFGICLIIGFSYVGVCHYYKAFKDGFDVFEGNCTGSYFNKLFSTWSYSFLGKQGEIIICIKSGYLSGKLKFNDYNNYRIYLKKDSLKKLGDIVPKFYEIYGYDIISNIAQ